MLLKEIYNQFRFVLPLWFVLLITNWLPDNRFSVKLRGFLASFFFKKCGRNLTLGKGLIINNPHKIEIGNDVYIAYGTWINGLGGLIIEDEVVIAPYVVISTLQHIFKDNSVRFGGSKAGKVVIGKGSWIAAHASIKCGVKVGKGNIVAANSFLVSDTEDMIILSGVPAKKVKDNQNGVAEFHSKYDIN